MKELNLPELIKNTMDTVKSYDKKANVLIAGKTGVGKSTLLNSMFSLPPELAAETSNASKPVTQQTQRYEKQGFPIVIYDTKGLEVKDYNEIRQELIQYIEKQNQSSEAENHIHVGWVLISEVSKRIEDAEIDLARDLSNNMPVIIVLTNAYSKKNTDFYNEAVKHFPFARKVVRVNSVNFNIDDDINVPPSGLDGLLDVTLQEVPEAQKRAFIRAQKIKKQLKIDESREIVNWAARAASTAAAVPVPFSDALTIIPIQLTMIGKITTTFGFELNADNLSKMVTGLVGTMAVTAGGRAIAGALLKLIPGVGSVLGGFISATVAGTLTKTLGEAYIYVLSEVPENASLEYIIDALKKKLSIS